VRAFEAVAFDRDGTLVADVPYNGDPSLVEPLPGAVESIHLLRDTLHLPLGVLTNQSGIARGLISRAQVDAVNHQVDALFGGFDGWWVCPHIAEDGCDCRKPLPGMALEMAKRFGVTVEGLLIVGDRKADLELARSIEAVGVLVMSPQSEMGSSDIADVVIEDLRELRDIVEAGRHA
jgi:D-glycero-D-manno-heptose 1,7-bisphosphate phosphatase